MCSFKLQRRSYLVYSCSTMYFLTQCACNTDDWTLCISEKPPKAEIKSSKGSSAGKIKLTCVVTYGDKPVTDGVEWVNAVTGEKLSASNEVEVSLKPGKNSFRCNYAVDGMSGYRQMTITQASKWLLSITVATKCQWHPVQCTRLHADIEATWAKASTPRCLTGQSFRSIADLRPSFLLLLLLLSAFPWALGVATADSVFPFDSVLCVLFCYSQGYHIFFYCIHEPPLWSSSPSSAWQFHRLVLLKTISRRQSPMNRLFI